MLQDVIIEPLKVIKDERGAVMHMMREDASFFMRFGEVYFSIVNAGVIKGWRKHTQQTQHFVVPEGNLKLVLFDARQDSTTCSEVQEINIGVDNYNLVRIPVGVVYGFQAMNNEKAIVANCTDIVHEAGETSSFELNDSSIPYSWKA